MMLYIVLDLDFIAVHVFAVVFVVGNVVVDNKG